MDFVVLRSLRRAPGHVLAVVATLGIGLAALLCAFLLVDAALWRAPPFPDAERIAMLYTTRHTDAGVQRQRWSFGRIKLLREAAADLGTVANYTPSTLALTGEGGAESITAEVVSPAYFSLLGARVHSGRAFLESEDRVEGAAAVLVLSHDLWRRRYAADPAILGRTIHVSGVAFTVIGVLQSGFRGLSDKAQLWIPTTMAPRVSYAEYLTTEQNFIGVVARLHDGVTWSEARTRMAVLGRRFGQLLPMDDPDPRQVVSATAVPLNDARVAPVIRRSLFLLFSAVALLYLLSVANVLNLMLGRAATRQREAAILSALGGPATRLVRHFLPEGIVLVLSGGLVALLLAWLASHFLIAPADVWGPRNFYGSLAAFAEPRFDGRTIVFALALTAVTLLLVAWAPAASAVRIDILAGLKEGGRGAAARSGTLRRPSLRGFIVACEAALALLLLLGGALMIDSFLRMRRTELGVDAERVLTFWIRPSEVRVPVAAAPEYITRVLNAITNLPGVVAASVDGGAPVSGTARSLLYIVGRPQPEGEDAPRVLRHYIGPDHFRVLGVPLLRGRLFNEHDRAGQPRVAIISESAARTFWPGQDPIGQRVWFSASNFNHPDSSAAIVGIVADVVHEPLDANPNRNEFYTPYMQFTYASRVVLVRTAGPPLAMVGPIRDALGTVDPDLPMVEVQTLPQLIGNSWARQRFDAQIFGAFALLALLLATSGIYAVVSYAVAQRTREMGIRMALGAQPGSIIALVVREGMGFPALGLLIGLAGSLVLGRFLQSALYEVQSTDPVVLTSALLILSAISALACLRPALRATRVDPVTAFRAD